MNTLTPTETETIIQICLLAAFADGQNHEREREQLRDIADSLGHDALDLPALYQHVLLRPPDVSDLSRHLTTPAARQLAFEMALCICDADGVSDAAEQAFLERLRVALGLSAPAAQKAGEEATSLKSAAESSDPSTGEADTDAMILRYAIAGGALELLPQTVATLAIVPMQTRMVYRIGKQHGFTLDRKSIVEFMAAIGVGMASQVFESFTRRLTRGLGRKMAGNLGDGIGDSIGGIATTFTSTYALGHLAKIYYDSGRRVTLRRLRALYPPLRDEGKDLAQRYAAQIIDRSETLKGAGVAGLMRSIP